MGSIAQSNGSSSNSGLIHDPISISGKLPTALELRNDPLMSLMIDTVPGDHYTQEINLRFSRLQRIDEIFKALKEQQIIPEYAEIDTPLARIALNAFLHGLYAPHYPKFAEAMPGRNGRDSTTVNFAALHHFLMKHGFTPEASSAFLERLENESDPLTRESWDAGQTFAHELWGKYRLPPPAEDLARQTEPRHLYKGREGYSPFAEARNDFQESIDEAYYPYIVSNPNKRRRASQ